MPSYRIFLLAESQVEGFRTGAPKPGPRVLKTRYYEDSGVIAADHPYQAWKRLQDRDAVDSVPRELGVGDVLAPEEGPPLLLNYWGFDPAEWADAEARDATLVEAV